MSALLARASLNGGLQMQTLALKRGIPHIPVRHLKVGPKGTYVAKMIPCMVKLEAGKRYSWCKCGLSKKQPFCDGAHKPTEFKPVRFEVDKTKSYLMCRCKQTSNEPFCDMTHVKIMMKSFMGKLEDRPIG